MSKFRIDSLETLARQMSFTPAATRLGQLNDAEKLLSDIDPAKAYPLDFVIFRITGYHPKTEPGDLLTGMALQNDLGLLIEQVSETLDVEVASLFEPVLSIDDVTERFHVTSKTVQRWRRRGLAARRFVYRDGKRRVGFLLSSVDRFLATHGQQAAEETNLSQIQDTERTQILRNARRLTEQCHCSATETARRIARKLHRSTLSILHTIRKHDLENPANAILSHAAAELREMDRAEILAGHANGDSLGELARQTGHAKQAIYRLVLEERIAELNHRRIRFIDDQLYHQADAAEAVNGIASAQSLPASQKGEELRIPRDLPPYLQDLYRTPLLTPGRERALFLKFNFHKFQFVQLRRRLEPEFARVRQLNELEAHLAAATETKNQIVRANLRLVVSVARKHLRPALNLMELISDGNITLMRAVDGFDIHKGYRLSTYATLALMKAFARSVPLMTVKQRSSARDEMLRELPDSHRDGAEGVLARDQVRQLLSKLNDRERDVIAAHFGIALNGGDAEPATYEQLSERMGLSKQRVRQIEQWALSKLRSESHS